MDNELKKNELLVNVDFLKLEISKRENDSIYNITNLVDKIIMLERKIFLETSYTRSQIEDIIRNNSYSMYVALKDKKEILSYIITLDSIDVEEIIKIGTLEEYRGTGISGKILEKLIKSELKNIILEVRESNRQGIRFYEKNGFKAISKRKKYYSDNGEDAIIMLFEIV